MPMLDGLKDENGKIKKPILISLIGAGGLLGYLMLSKGTSGTTTSAGQSSPLTPDLTALQTALQSLGQGNNTSGGGGGSSSSPSLDPPADFFGPSTPSTLTTPTTSSNPGYLPTNPAPLTTFPIGNQIPLVN